MSEFKLTDEQADALIDEVKASVKKTKDGQPHSWDKIIEAAIRVGIVVPADCPYTSQRLAEFFNDCGMQENFQAPDHYEVARLMKDWVENKS